MELPSVIECSTGLERGMLAYLLDARTEHEKFEIRQEDSSCTEDRQVLQKKLV